MLLRVINILYPSFIFFMLFLACVAQVVSCFSRTRVHCYETNFTINYHVVIFIVIGCPAHRIG